MDANERAYRLVESLANANRDEQAGPAQPRQPHNLQHLLRFAMDAAVPIPAGMSVGIGPMNEERRRFLEDALKSLTVDVPKMLENGIKILSDVESIKSIQCDDPVPDEIMAAFNNVVDYVGHIDVANDFEKLGGFAIFPLCYESENEEIRIAASNLLAEVCQNNPHCQARVLESGLLNTLLHLAVSERGLALVKCIGAISCATRGYDPGCREVIAQGGCETLANVLDLPDFASRTKAAFFIRYLCQNYPETKEKFLQSNILKIIADQLKSGRDVTSEHLLCVLQSLVKDTDPSYLRRSNEDPINLRKVIEAHWRLVIKDKDLIEEKEYCEDILLAFDSLPPVDDDNDVDR